MRERCEALRRWIWRRPKTLISDNTIGNFKKSLMFFIILRACRPQNTASNLYVFWQSFKTHHKMRGWNREFAYLSARIVGKTSKYQDLSAKSTTFDSPQHLFAPLRRWIQRCMRRCAVAPLDPTVRACAVAPLDPTVHAPLRRWISGGPKSLIFDHTVGNFRKSPMYFTVLRARRPQNTA